MNAKIMCGAVSSVLLIILLTAPSMMLATRVNARVLPAQMELTMTVVQIQRSYMIMDFELSQDGSLTPTNVTLYNVEQIASTGDCPPSSSGSIQVCATASGIASLVSATFDNWTSESGRWRSSQMLYIDLFNNVTAFPDDEFDIRLHLSSNATLQEPVYESSVSTYVASGQSSGGSPTGNYTYGYDIALLVEHPSGFRTLANLTGLTPWALGVISVIIFLLFILDIFNRGPKWETRDYLQAMLTTFLFIPLFVIGLGLLVPQVPSAFVSDWMNSVAVEIEYAFGVTAVLTFLVLAISATTGHSRKAKLESASGALPASGSKA